jgi:AraC-like DNA-binding protein
VSGVFWGEADLQPHRSRYWLNAKTKATDPDGFAAQVETVCTLYAYAPLLHHLGGHVVSCDELTAREALERAAPTVPMQPGQVERREYEYIRHGTLSLITNFDIATGQVLAPALGLMHSDPGHSWQLKELAQAAAMSRTTFAVRFKQAAGVAPLTYLTQWRMRLAERALREQDTPVADLARSLGYTSESAFSNAFKRVMGSAPRRYRSAVRG